MSLRTSDFDYPLPPAAIAQSPVEPRDSARLLVVDGMQDHHFRDLPGLLQPGDLVVVNDTRVRAARLIGHRQPGGGAVEVLLLERRPDGHWEALIRPARRIRPGQSLDFTGLTATVVTPPVEGEVVLRLESDGDAEAMIEEAGRIALPPYITADLEDPDRYQTVYAATPGSAAAPTAGLHFTDRVLSGLRAGGVELAKVELRVGVDTFRPITAETVEEHRMHSEWIAVPAATAAAIGRTRRREGAVVAVGTTVVRALESRAGDGGVEPGQMRTDLFIRPGFRFRVVDRLVTNFHLPRSSLIVMVAAFMGGAWRETYETALARGYRFLSFGDAMLVDRRETPADG